VVRYVHLPAGEVDRGLLEDASRRGELCTLLLFDKGGGKVSIVVGVWADRSVCIYRGCKPGRESEMRWHTWCENG
jgi:hypothetical protein